MALPNMQKILRRATRFIAAYEKVLLAILAIVILISGGFWYRQFAGRDGDSPTVGGTYVEGVVADKKEMSQITTRLTKAGLLSFSETGVLQGQLAETWSANTDETQFRFTLSPTTDRAEVAAILQSRDDVVGTIDVKTDLDRDVVVTLPEPNPSFPLLMTRPLFDYGPFKLSQSNDQTTVFTRNTRRGAVAAYLNKIVIHSYATDSDLQKALSSDRIDGAISSTDPHLKNWQSYQISLSRYYAVLFNTNKSPFRDAGLRQSLTAGTPAAATPFTLIAADQEPYKTLATDLAAKWKEQGAKVELSLRPLSEVTNNIGPARNFQALLVGIDYGLELDPYYLWHSSQVRATGNNVTGINNVTIDSLVEKTRANLDPAARQRLLEELHTTLTSQGVMMVVKEQNLTYYLSDKIRFIPPSLPSSEADRFLSSALWSVK